MTHLQKKCFVAAAGSHFLLLVILLAAAAFRPKPDLTEDQVLAIVPTKLLDNTVVGGGAIAPTPTPPVRSSANRSAPVARPEPRPRSIPRDRATMLTDPDPKPSKSKPAMEKTAPSSSSKSAREFTFSGFPTHNEKRPVQEADPAVASPSRNDSLKNESKEIQKEAEELAKMVVERAGKPTVLTLPGESSGETFSGYKEYLGAIYRESWTPQTTTDGVPMAEVTIVVSRDGTVLSSKIVKRSRDSLFDSSVQRVLDHVSNTKLRPFPAGATDEQRSFSITFKPEPKLSSG